MFKLFNVLKLDISLNLKIKLIWQVKGKRSEIKYKHFFFLQNCSFVSLTDSQLVINLAIVITKEIVILPLTLLLSKVWWNCKSSVCFQMVNWSNTRTVIQQVLLPRSVSVGDNFFFLINRRFFFALIFLPCNLNVTTPAANIFSVLLANAKMIGYWRSEPEPPVYLRNIYVWTTSRDLFLSNQYFCHILQVENVNSEAKNIIHFILSYEN